MKNYTEFHDGTFEGLWSDDGATCHVYLCTEKKERFTAVLGGVLALSANNFRARNLIFEVITREDQEISISDIAELYDLQKGAGGGEKQGWQLLERARREKMVLLAITPSYGGSCLVLAHSFDLKVKDS